MEIQARKESNRQLRAESLQQVEQTNASVHKVDKKIEVVLGAQRMLHSHHEALQVQTLLRSALLCSTSFPGGKFCAFSVLGNGLRSSGCISVASHMLGSARVSADRS